MCGENYVKQGQTGWEHCPYIIFWGIISLNIVRLHDFQLATVCLPAEHWLLYAWKWSALIGWLILQAGHMIDETPHGENPSRGEFCTDLVLAIFQCFNEKIRYFWIGPARYGSVNAISGQMGVGTLPWQHILGYYIFKCHQFTWFSTCNSVPASPALPAVYMKMERSDWLAYLASRSHDRWDPPWWKPLQRWILHRFGLGHISVF